MGTVCDSSLARWYQKTRMITLSFGIKISAVYSIVSSQSTHVIDRQTDRQTDRRTDGQNYDPKTALA